MFLKDIIKEIDEMADVLSTCDSRYPNASDVMTNGVRRRLLKLSAKMKARQDDTKKILTVYYNNKVKTTDKPFIPIREVIKDSRPETIPGPGTAIYTCTDFLNREIPKWTL